MKDYYSLMGLAQDASPEEIKEAYRALAYIYHPDRHRDSPKRVLKFAEIMMKQLNEAYQVLSDPVQRGEFDNTMRTGSSDLDLSGAVRRAYSSVTRDDLYAKPEAKPQQKWSYDDYLRENPDVIVSPKMLRVLVDAGQRNVQRKLKFHNMSSFPVDLDVIQYPEWLSLKFLTSRRINPDQVAVIQVSWLDRIYRYNKLYVDGTITIETSGNPSRLEIKVETTIA